MNGTVLGIVLGGRKLYMSFFPFFRAFLQYKNYTLYRKSEYKTSYEHFIIGWYIREREIPQKGLFSTWIAAVLFSSPRLSTVKEYVIICHILIDKGFVVTGL